jgi:HEAT repeat protein
MVSDEELQQQVELLGSRDWRVATAAYDALVQAGQSGLHAVIAGLQHADPRVRRGCAGFMDHQGTDLCVPLLYEVARHDPVAAVRREAVHALGCERCKPSPLHTDGTAFLIERALHDTSVKVRREAVSGLGMLQPDARAAGALRTILDQDGDRDLLRLAHRALRYHDAAYRRTTDAQARARSTARPMSNLS